MQVIKIYLSTKLYKQMVVRRRYPLRRRRVRRHRGRGFFDALRSAHDFIKKKKIISTVGNALSKVGVPYAGIGGD